MNEPIENQWRWVAEAQKNVNLVRCNIYVALHNKISYKHFIRWSKTMSKKPKDTTMNMQMPENVKEFAEKTVDEAQKAFDKAGEMAHKNVQIMDASASALKANSADLQMKVMEIAQNNVNQAFGFARQLLATQEPTALYQLQQDFMRGQVETLTKQLGELNEISVKLARETSKPVQETMLEAFNQMTSELAKVTKPSKG